MLLAVGLQRGDGGGVLGLVLLEILTCRFEGRSVRVQPTPVLVEFAPLARMLGRLSVESLTRGGQFRAIPLNPIRFLSQSGRRGTKASVELVFGIVRHSREGGFNPSAVPADFDF